VTSTCIKLKRTFRHFQFFSRSPISFISTHSSTIHPLLQEKEKQWHHSTTSSIEQASACGTSQQSLANSAWHSTHVFPTRNIIGVDYESRPMVVLCACNLPDPSKVDYDVILRYFLPSCSSWMGGQQDTLNGLIFMELLMNCIRPLLSLLNIHFPE